MGKGFFESILGDFATAMDMKAAIETARDENGKVDKWKATAISMGMGHMSDSDICTLGAMLGAAGAFDSDDDFDF